MRALLSYLHAKKAKRSHLKKVFREMSLPMSIALERHLVVSKGRGFSLTVHCAMHLSSTMGSRFCASKCRISMRLVAAFGRSAAIRTSKRTERDVISCQAHGDLRFTIAVSEDLRFVEFPHHDDRASFFEVRDHLVELLSPDGDSPPDGFVFSAAARSCSNAECRDFLS